uniref:Uncharacterized protein n=1 Tax=Arundo donax TaxID=35708 RepID=A0A0A9E4U0_ARUDO
MFISVISRISINREYNTCDITN